MSDSLQLGLSLNFPQSELNKLDAIFNKIKRMNDALNGVGGTKGIKDAVKIQEQVNQQINKSTAGLNNFVNSVNKGTCA